MRLVIYMFDFLSLRDWYPIGLSVLVSAVVGLASKHVPLWLPHEGVLYWDILCLWQSGLGWCHGKQDGFQPRSILKRGSLALMRVQYGRALVAYAFPHPPFRYRYPVSSLGSPNTQARVWRSDRRPSDQWPQLCFSMSIRAIRGINKFSPPLALDYWTGFMDSKPPRESEWEGLSLGRFLSSHFLF